MVPNIFDSTIENSIPLSAYIHIPWCIRKCPYCDFNSHAIENGMDESLYLKALIADMTFQAQQHNAIDYEKRKIQTVFIGGGTPSLFSATSIQTILNTLQQHYGFASNIEVTMEANPGTTEHDNLSAYRDAGVNRLSLGIQSFDPQQLVTLGRIHDDKQATLAIDQAMNSGFDSVNLDLMHALPNQNPEQALRDLQQAISFAPQHISWYQLTIEKNTLFHHQPPPLPSDDNIAQIQNEGITLLAEQGYAQYEISAFSKENFQCRHNINYWQFGDYLGFGAGAHAKLSSHNKNGGLSINRQSRCKHPQQYMELAGTLASFEQTELNNTDSDTSVENLIFEFLMNHLRLFKTLTRELFCSRTGLSWSQLVGHSTEAIRQDLLKVDDKQLILTPQGVRFLNNTLMLFLPKS